MKNKILNLILIMAFLISLVSFSANAAFGDIFRAGLTPIENFFSGGWQNYEKTVSFIVFFFLFFSTYLIGMKKAFKELSRAHTVFAFTAAFLSAMIIATTLKFDWINLKYVGWGLIVILILFLIYSILSKLLGKHKFLAFILALIITALLLWLIWYLMSEGRPLEDWGRVSNWFGTLGKGIGTGKGEKGKAEPWPEGPPLTSKPQGTVTQPQKGGLGRYWWMLILIVVLITHGVAGGIGRRRGRGFWRGIGNMYGLPVRGVRWARWRYANRQLRRLINAALRRMTHRRITVADRQEILRALRLAHDMIDRLNRGMVLRQSRIKTLRRHINTILARRGVRTI